MTSPKLLAIGGALVDRRGRSAGRFLPGVSNPGTMREEIGGAAFNTARGANRFGVSVTMMTVLGGDAGGQSVAAAIRQAGIDDKSATHLDRTTPSYTAILDEQGELKAALADMGLYEIGFVKLARRASTRNAISGTDALLLDANLPETAISLLVGHAGSKPVYANAISPTKAERFISELPRLACLFMNSGEASALVGGQHKGGTAGLVAKLRDRGLRSGVITQGASAIILFDEADAWSLQPPDVRIADVTGAGDALAGAVIAAMMNGLSLPKAIRNGAAGAALVASSDNVSPAFSDDRFAQMLERVPEAKSLDILQATP